MCPIKVITAQGRRFDAAELLEIQQLIDENPNWSRARVALELCQRWEWRTVLGQPKSFAARSLLLKLAQRYDLRLPPLREAFRRHPWGVRPPEAVPIARAEFKPIESDLASLMPLSWEGTLPGGKAREQALDYLRSYHYLGCNRPVGSHLLYLVQDGQGRDLAVHLVGAAAWHCAARDRYIGWSEGARRAGLHRIANHSRFLILPWVRVPHLSSHLLGELTGRIGSDWQQQHGWELELLESFVETGRFEGTAYRAAGWQEVGQTTGRTRQVKEHEATAPPKSVWVYGLEKDFRQRLRAPAGPGAGAQ
jgi:hypothetical protein